MTAKNVVPKDFTPTPSSTERPGGLSVLVRLLWMVVGNVVLVVAAISIHHNRTLPSTADVVFWTTVAAMFAIRYIDGRFLRGRTATGEPATPASYRAYAVRLAVVAIMLWVAAHLIPPVG
jgi:hypothetical protein